MYQFNVRTVVSIEPAKTRTESITPGLALDRAEDYKLNHHSRIIDAFGQRACFVPIAIDENGRFGPLALQYFDRIFSTSDNPIATKTYWMRYFAVQSARALFTLMHSPHLNNDLDNDSRRRSRPIIVDPANPPHQDHDVCEPQVLTMPGQHLLGDQDVTVNDTESFVDTYETANMASPSNSPAPGRHHA